MSRIKRIITRIRDLKFKAKGDDTGMDMDLRVDGKVVKAHVTFCHKTMVGTKAVTVHNHPPDEPCKA